MKNKGAILIGLLALGGAVWYLKFRKGALLGSSSEGSTGGGGGGASGGVGSGNALTDSGVPVIDAVPVIPIGGGGLLGGNTIILPAVNPTVPRNPERNRPHWIHGNIPVEPIGTGNPTHGGPPTSIGGGISGGLNPILNHPNTPTISGGTGARPRPTINTGGTSGVTLSGGVRSGATPSNVSINPTLPTPRYGRSVANDRKSIVIAKKINAVPSIKKSNMDADIISFMY